MYSPSPKVITALPRLERFVKDVCGFVVNKSHGAYTADGRPLPADEALKRSVARLP
jgi:hypothetical protein